MQTQNEQPESVQVHADVMREVLCDDGTWTVEISGNSDCKIRDPHRRLIHHSIGHESTAVHFAMALSELRGEITTMNVLRKAERS